MTVVAGGITTILTTAAYALPARTASGAASPLERATTAATHQFDGAQQRLITAPAPQDDLPALVECRVGATTRTGGFSSLPPTELCYAGVMVVATPGTCGVQVKEDWTWPFTTGRYEQRVLPPATVAAGVTDLTVLRTALETINDTTAVVPVGLSRGSVDATCVFGDTIKWWAGRQRSKPTTYQVAYVVNAGQTAASADKDDPSPSVNRNSTSVRLAMRWAPGKNWTMTLHNVRVRFVLPQGATDVVTKGPGAADAVVSNDSASVRAAPSVTFPFTTLPPAPKSTVEFRVTYTLERRTLEHTWLGRMAPPACEPPAEADACRGPRTATKYDLGVGEIVGAILVVCVALACCGSSSGSGARTSGAGGHDGGGSEGGSSWWSRGDDGVYGGDSDGGDGGGGD